MIDYLSHGWFSAVTVLLRRRPSDVHGLGRIFVVDHVLHGAPEGCSRLHTQAFVDHHLVTWTSGLSGRADLTVRRAYDVDKQDLLGRGHADRVADVTALQGAGVPSGDVFGIEAYSELSTALPPGLKINFGLHCADTPFGGVERDYVLRGNRLAPTGSVPVDLFVAGPYVSLLSWIHDAERLLGHLLVCPDHATNVEGDYFKMSAVEGCISAPRDSSSSDHARRLATYAACRNHGDFIAMIDEIDVVTR